MPTQNTASVRVENASSKNFVSVGVVHKYSNLFKDGQTWKNLAPGQTTSQPTMTASYNTGFLTTGEDWWYILAADDKGNIYQTDPDNARRLWDGVDNAADFIKEELLSSIPEEVEAAPATEGASALAAACQAAAAAAVSALVNTEATAGFKEFLLKSEDAQDGVLISISDSDVTFSASSGTATTPLHSAGTVTSPAPRPVTA